MKKASKILIYTFLPFFTLVLALSACRQNTAKLSEHHAISEYLPVDSAQQPVSDSAMTNTIRPYKQHVDSMMNVALGQAAATYEKSKPNGSLNNLAADMVYEYTMQSLEQDDVKPDFCLLNYGGLRHGIAKGTITLSDIYQLMPFQNEVVIVKLSGQKVYELFQYISATGGQPVSHCTVKVKNRKFVSATIGGKPFNRDSSYYVLTSDYVAGGGDRMKFFKNPEKLIKTGLLLRNAMIEYVKQQRADGHLITASTEERIIEEP